MSHSREAFDLNSEYRNFEISWDKLNFTDKSKQLIVLYVVDHHPDGIQIDKDLFSAYIYLLNEEGYLPFEYQFIFDSWPISEQVESDFYGNFAAGFIELTDNKISLTEIGKKRIKDLSKDSDLGIILDKLRPVSIFLEKLGYLNKQALHQRIYSHIASNE